MNFLQFRISEIKTAKPRIASPFMFGIVIVIESKNRFRFEMNCVKRANKAAFTIDKRNEEHRPYLLYIQIICRTLIGYDDSDIRDF